MLFAELRMEWKELIQSAPPLVVLCFTVVAFLKYLVHRDNQTSASLNRIADAIEQNTKATEALSESIEKVKVRR